MPIAGFGVIWRSQAMSRVFRLVESLEQSESTVLLTGESGTGKEMVARALHARSRRRDGPFVAVNCAAIPETLLESELFGHTRGAFTGAVREHVGLFVKADGGTLFLDEVAELPAKLQPKLLRALQERAVRPIGSGSEVPFDVRLIAATNRDLQAEPTDGFRQDLFFRLAVIQIELPPLRARFDIAVPDGVTLAPFAGFDISPDGRRALMLHAQSTRTRIWDLEEEREELGDETASVHATELAWQRRRCRERRCA